MLGAITGDIIGSGFEFNGIKIPILTFLAEAVATPMIQQ